MQKFTEKVHSEQEKPEVVWIKREEAEDTTETEARAHKQMPIVYSKQYGVNFAKLEKLHPFDAQKGRNIAKVCPNKICKEIFSINSFPKRFF